MFFPHPRAMEFQGGVPSSVLWPSHGNKAMFHLIDRNQRFQGMDFEQLSMMITLWLFNIAMENPL